MSAVDLDPILYGSAQIPRIVAVEIDGDRRTAILYRRDPEGRIESVKRPFVPWLLCAEERYFQGSVTSPLTGAGFKWRIDFDQSGWYGFTDARRALHDQHVPILCYGSQTKQFLVASGIALFQEMTFEHLHRMQIDIETTGLSPSATDAAILLAAVSDNRGRSLVLTGDESTIIDSLAAIIHELDPDVLEGHNLFGFDLPYILGRCAYHGIEFRVGRDRTTSIQVGNERTVAIGANSRPFIPYYVHGRHIVDTYIQVQRFDVARGRISSYGLKECAQVYNLAPKDRVYLDHTEIVDVYRQDPQRVKAYALHDVEETRALAELITPTDFYQTQLVRDSYQSVAVAGNGEKVNTLLVREYLRQGHAIPFQQESREYPGGYTEVRAVGVIKPVVKTDVESLYPSIMLSQSIRPSSDTLNVFLPLLAELTGRRLAAKLQMRRYDQLTNEHAYWDGLQGSVKILINSFYGYLGGPFYFNDYSAAKKVTEEGQRLVKLIASQLEATGSHVIEIDTDGVYFQPPQSIVGLAAEEAYIDNVARVLPPGIRLTHDGRYAAMLSLKIKNYVLVNEDGSKIFKGSSLRSRADEPFGREFLAKAIDLLIDGRHDELKLLYQELIERIYSGTLPIEQIARRERITEKLLNSELRRRFGEAVKSTGLKEGDIARVYLRANGSVGLAEQYAFDADPEYYAAKLHKFAQRLSGALDEATMALSFPKPKRPDQRLQERLQTALDI